MIRRRVLIFGEVHGVYFRDTCRRLAVQRSVSGWVRNLPDGSVEAAFEGQPGAVDQMIAWARKGPSTAMVDAVEVYDEEPQRIVGFDIRPSPAS